MMTFPDLLFHRAGSQSRKTGKICSSAMRSVSFRPLIAIALTLQVAGTSDLFAQSGPANDAVTDPLSFAVSEASSPILAGEEDKIQDQPSLPSPDLSPALVDPALSETNGAQLPLDETGAAPENSAESLSTSDVISQPITESTDGSGLADLTPSGPAGTDQTTEAVSDRQDGDTIRFGPRIRSPLSLLFAEQRPFLLHSQDASITYLMPHAVRGYPEIGRHLRATLEDRALNHWMLSRDLAQAQPPDLNRRPILVVNGRVEDRFSSSIFASLLLNEDRTQSTTPGKTKTSASILTFNYDYRSSEPLLLETLFAAESDRERESVVALLAAYIRADIIRQKSIRLATEINAEQDAWVKEFQPTLAQLQAFTLVPSRTSGKIAGLQFSFQPGELGAANDGPYHVYVPAAIFTPNLAEAYADFFADNALNVSSFNAAGFSNATIHLQTIRKGSELGGMMVIEGEVPNNWCDGFHLSLTDKGTIIAEAQVELLPDLPPYGISSHMIRFRAEMTVNGEGDKNGELLFEPYRIEHEAGRMKLRKASVCKPDTDILQPQPRRDSVRLEVVY